MKNKSVCSRCGKEITDNTFGYKINAEELLVCEDCEREHKKDLIAELDNFRRSTAFNDILALRKKVLWTSESLGYINDNADKSIHESVSYYDNYNVFELQVTLLDILQTLLGKFIRPDLEIDYSKEYPEHEKLRLEVREQQGRIASYIDYKEFMNK